MNQHIDSSMLAAGLAGWLAFWLAGWLAGIRVKRRLRLASVGGIDGMGERNIETNDLKRSSLETLDGFTDRGEVAIGCGTVGHDQ